MNAVIDRPARLLLIEDNPGDVRLIREYIRDEGRESFQIENADRLATGLEVLTRGGADLVLLDLSLPDSRGLDTLAKVRGSAPEIPVVVLTGWNDADTAVRAVRKGAQDYLVKGEINGNLLLRSIRYAIERKRFEMDLLSSNERYRSLLENMVEGYAYCRMMYDGARPVDFVYIDVNEAFKRLTGMSDVIGKKVSEVIPGIQEADPELFDTYCRVALTGKPERFVTYVNALSNWYSISSYSSKKGDFVTVFDVITGRKQAEETTSRLVAIVTTSDDAILSKTLDGTIISWNLGAERLYGYTAAEMVGQSTMTIIPPEFQSEHKEILQRIARGEHIELHETVRVRKDGSRIDVSVRLSPINNAGGEVTGVSVIGRDISMRKRVEEEIKGLAKFPSENPEPVMRISTGGTVLYINESGSKQLSEWNLQVGTIAPSFLRDAVSQALNDGSRKMIDLEYGESTYSFSVSPVRDGGYANLYARNVTESKRMENALKESERKYRILVANAGEAIFIAQNETIKFPNPKALEITGYSTEELVGISLLKLTHPEDRDMVVERYISRLRGGPPPPTPTPFRILKKTGDVAWVRGTAGLIDWEGKPGLLCFFRDITTEKNLEAQVTQSQKLEAVGRLAGGIAHDFNNLLTVSIGYCDLGLTRISETHPLRNDLEEIRKSSDRCAALTRQLLAFSRKQILEPKVINLGDVVADMDKMLRRLIREDIELVSVREKGLWNVKADPGQIEQVIVNLVVNSRDAMSAGGKLAIEAANVELDELYAKEHNFVPPGAYVRLAVSDTGQGMDEATLARIFEPFFTTKEKGKGTGLGLSTVYGIVNQSGGHINVYSEPGIGTTFKIYFPRVEETVTAISGSGVLRPEELRGSETILLVEDEELVRKMVREVLVQLGYSVVEARSGSEAIDLCARHLGTIHLMLSDVVMPGMSGVELSKQLAPFHPEMKVLFMSGYTANAIVHQGILDPGVAFLHKPFTMYSLAHKVREVLGSGIKGN